MELIKEEYTNKEGKTVILERYIGKNNQYVLRNEEYLISPMVSSITYDDEHELFFVVDDYYSIDEFGRKGNRSARVYFYIDFDGNPVGMAYTDAFDGLIDIQAKYRKYAYGNWFLAIYREFKKDLGINLEEEFESRVKHHDECAKKMLSLYTKKENN